MFLHAQVTQQEPHACRWENPQPGLSYHKATTIAFTLWTKVRLGSSIRKIAATMTSALGHPLIHQRPEKLREVRKQTSRN